jgi:Golgi phosphoprotein 3 (GPP34)
MGFSVSAPRAPTNGAAPRVTPEAIPTAPPGQGALRRRSAVAIVTAMETLGEDLLLLAVRPNGTLGLAAKLRFALSGSELVRLAAARRVDIVRGRIAILDATPTGDALLDAALLSMETGKRQPAAKAWVARTRPGLVQQYLDRLAAAGVIRAERRKMLGLFPVTRWQVVDTARLAQVRARLDAVASSSAALDSAQAAFAGLADAIGLSLLIYPGFSGAAARRNLKTAAKRDRPAGQEAAARAGDSATAVNAGDTPAAVGAVDRAARAATSAAMDAATSAAMDAATRAATDAAVAASIDAATQAAVSAATDAAHHAASHHGGAVGGHH